MPPFGPDDVYAVAKSLKERQLPAGEGRWRTVMGRAYYSAFLATCRALCRAHKFPMDSYFNHELVTETLAAYTADKDVRILGTLLHSMRLNRVHADYRLTTPFNEDTADDAVGDSRMVLDGLKIVEAKLPRIEPSKRQ